MSGKWGNFSYLDSMPFTAKFLMCLIGGIVTFMVVVLWSEILSATDGRTVRLWDEIFFDHIADKSAFQKVRNGGRDESNSSSDADDLFLLRKVFRQTVVRRWESAILVKLSNAREYRRKITALPNGTTSDLFISFNPLGGGLGNFMFMMASTIGIGRSTMRIAALRMPDARANFFEGFSLPIMKVEDGFSDHKLYETGAAVFSPHLLFANQTFPARNVTLYGYLQSWKYFAHIRDEIRLTFTFGENVMRTAKKSVQDLMENLPIELFRNASELPVLAGIHVRRGDILEGGGKEHGHVPATAEYLLRMVSLVEEKYGAVIFIVVSNDGAYCKDIFRQKNIAFVKEGSAEVDMAIISLLDVIVLSVGTYGWWGAYLSDAKDVFYYKDWPRNGSAMQKVINHDDFFLPDWQGKR